MQRPRGIEQSVPWPSSRCTIRGPTAWHEVLAQLFLLAAATPAADGSRRGQIARFHLLEYPGDVAHDDFQIIVQK
jgi:hypothetical protein